MLTKCNKMFFFGFILLKTRPRKVTTLHPRPLPSDFALTPKKLHTFAPPQVGLIPGVQV